MIGTDTQHLVKVIAALVEFTPAQRQKVFAVNAMDGGGGGGWFSGFGSLLSSPSVSKQ
jgi:hypothetical protein